MSIQKDDLSQIKSAVAVLNACIVQTLNESDVTFQTRFLERLELAYRERREEAGLHELEVLIWARELLTGFSFGDGQGKPFLGR